MGTLTVQPSAKDTFLSQISPTINYSAYAYLDVRDRNAQLMRPILEFDISEIPAEQTIISAVLSLYYYALGYTDPVGKTIWAYKLTRTDWVAAQASWNIYKTGSDWTLAGGDYVTSDPSGGSTTFPADWGWMAWNVLAIVQNAYAGSIPAEFLVRFATEGLASGYSTGRFYSNVYTDNLTLRPKLVVGYEAVAPPVGRSFGFIIG